MPIEGEERRITALVEENRIHELWVWEEETLRGKIFIGQVETIAKNISAAFVLFGREERGYLPIDSRETVFLADGRQGWGDDQLASGLVTTESLRCGDMILVQVVRDAMRGKLPALSGKLDFSGRYFAASVPGTGIGVSRKLPAKEKERLRDWTEKMLSRDGRLYGFPFLWKGEADDDQSPKKQKDTPFLVIRTNAAQADEDELCLELKSLLGQIEQVIRFGPMRTKGSLLYRPLTENLRILQNLPFQTLEAVVTDDEELYRQFQEYLSGCKEDLSGILRWYEDPLLPLYHCYSFQKTIEEIRQKKVWLKSGAFLVIEQTEAFVSIDVNTGKCVTGNDKEKTFYRINCEASAEIAWQLRLRGLSGVILIDFINMKQQENRKALMAHLASCLFSDPAGCQVVDMTKLGIVEVTRKKIRPSVVETIEKKLDMVDTKW